MAVEQDDGAPPNRTSVWEGPEYQFVHIDHEQPGAPICIGAYGQLDEAEMSESEAISMALAILKLFAPDRVRA